jgi:hypothetical protein
VTDPARDDRSRRSWFAGVVGGAILIVACTIVALLLANLVDLARPGTLFRGRDIRRAAMLAAALIGIAGVWWSLARGHGWAEMVASLLVTEVLIAALIVAFSGSATFDAFFFDWFLGVNLYTGAPWLLALIIGIVINRFR